MRLVEISRRAWLIGAALVFMAAPLAHAAAPVKAVGPDPAANPVLATMIKAGARLYYMGTRSGLDGWFIVKDGQVQIAYGTADHQAVIIGAMFGDAGESISGDQVKALLQTNNDVRTLLTGAAQEQAAINNVGSGAASSNTAMGVSTPNATTPNVTMPGSLPSVAVSPGERLLQDLNAASGVKLGGGGPQLTMIMDPNCPHCQATWKALRDNVFKNSLQIRLVPIGTEGTDNERAAAILLHVPDTLNVWDKYVGGDKTQLAGSPDPALIAAVRANHELVDSWNIHVTPCLVYRGKDGKVKIVQGEPDKIAAVIGDLGALIRHGELASENPAHGAGDSAKPRPDAQDGHAAAGGNQSRFAAASAAAGHGARRPAGGFGSLRRGGELSFRRRGLFFVYRPVVYRRAGAAAGHLLPRLRALFHPGQVKARPAGKGRKGKMTAAANHLKFVEMIRGDKTFYPGSLALFFGEHE